MPAARRRDSATPSDNSINGTAQLPISVVVFAAHRGSSAPTAWSSNASATAYNSGVRTTCRRSRPTGGDGRPESELGRRQDGEENHREARAPASPNANRHKGMPMLPELGKISAGK